jgi:hypothetical protein
MLAAGLIVAAIGLTVTAAGSPAAQAQPPKHHVTAGRLRFAAWGLRTLVAGRPKVVFSAARQFSHCLSQPLVRLTANFRFSGLASGTKLSDAWYLGPRRYAGSVVALPRGVGQYLGFPLAALAGLPDGVITVKVSLRGRLAAERSIRLSTSAC